MVQACLWAGKGEKKMMNAFETWQQLQDESALFRAVRRDQEESYWSRYAENYDQRRHLGSGLTREIDTVLDLIDRSMDVLEIGAGTGAYTLPLAEKAARVTAVEPSPAMRAVLSNKLDRYDIRNVTLYGDRWEEAQIEPHDVVLAAGCIYVFYDIRQALSKMVRHARKVLVLTSGVDRYTRIYNDAAQRLGVNPPGAGPSYIHLYNVLYQMGIYANVNMIHSQSTIVFDDMAHAVDTWTDRLQVPLHKVDKLREYIESRMVFTRDGKLSMGQVHGMTAILWASISGADA